MASKIFPNRCREIPAMDGGILLQQIRVGKNAYLHHFVKPEPLDIFHKHRWKHMRSFVLFGKYREQRFDASSKDTTTVEHRVGQTFTMDESVIHRISYWSPKCWTLFFFYGDGQDWGYYDKQGNYTPWQDYIPLDKRANMSDKGACKHKWKFFSKRGPHCSKCFLKWSKRKLYK